MTSPLFRSAVCSLFGDDDDDEDSGLFSSLGATKTTSTPAAVPAGDDGAPPAPTASEVRARVGCSVLAMRTVGSFNFAGRPDRPIGRRVSGAQTKARTTSVRKKAALFGDDDEDDAIFG